MNYKVQEVEKFYADLHQKNDINFIIGELNAKVNHRLDEVGTSLGIFGLQIPKDKRQILVVFIQHHR